MASSRSRRRTTALLVVVVAAVVALAFAATPSHTNLTTAATAAVPLADSPGIGAARRSCNSFASLVADLRAGTVGPETLTVRAAALVEQAVMASTADRAMFTRLADDAGAFDQALSTNDPTAAQAAQVLAADCQGILGSTPARV